MIDYTEFRGAIESYLDGFFTVLPIVFENVEIGYKEEHVSVIDQDISSSPVGMGSNARIVIGVLVFEIHTKYGSGTNLARTAASELSTLLSGDNVQGVTFSEPEFMSVGKMEGISIYRHNLIVRYTYVYGQTDTSNC